MSGYVPPHSLERSTLAIKFWSTVTNQRKTPITGSVRFSPLIHFLIEDLQELHFGLTTLASVEWPFIYGETKRAHFTMFGVPEFEVLMGKLVTGVRFGLSEGTQQFAHGIVEEIEECTVDR